MVDVEDHRREGKEAVVDRPQPPSAVGQEDRLLRHEGEAPVELAPCHPAEVLPPRRRGDVGRRVVVARRLPFPRASREERRELDLARLRLLPVHALDAFEVFPEHGYARAVAEDVGQRLAARLPGGPAREGELPRGRRAADHDVAHRVGGDAEPVCVLEFQRGLPVAVDRRQPQDVGHDRRRVSADKPHALVPGEVPAVSLRVVVRPRDGADGAEEGDDALPVDAAVPFAGHAPVVVPRRRLRREQGLHQLAAHRLGRGVQAVLELARAADPARRHGVGRALHQRRRAGRAPEGDLEDFF